MITKAAILVLMCSVIAVHCSPVFTESCDISMCEKQFDQCKTLCSNKGNDSPSCVSAVKKFVADCSECRSSTQGEQLKGSSMENNGTLLNNTSPNAHIEDCGFWTGVSCAGIILGCAAVCSAAEVDAPACIACLGRSYITCKDCIPIF